MAEQVIGAFQVDEAARAWVSGIEQTPAFLRCDDSVLRRMQHQLRLARASGHAAFVRAQGVEPGRIAVVAAERGGIPDPFGGDDEVYEACAAVLAGEAGRIAGELAAEAR